MEIPELTKEMQQGIDRFTEQRKRLCEEVLRLQKQREAWKKEQQTSPKPVRRKK